MSKLTRQDNSYPPARGPVLLLSCMDLRLLDEVVQFMAHDGLGNRYDHVILAGAALGALGGDGHYSHWRTTFFDHLKTAHELHHIKDIYILEHRDCGAYREILKALGTFNDFQLEEEEDCHRKYAKALTREIYTWSKEHQAGLLVKSFLMDLRGRVQLLGRWKKYYRKWGKLDPPCPCHPPAAP